MNMSHNVRKRIFGHVRPAQIKISLRIHIVRSEPSLGAFWIAKDARVSHSGNKDWSDCVDVQIGSGLCGAHISEVPSEVSSRCWSHVVNCQMCLISIFLDGDHCYIFSFRETQQVFLLNL